MYAWRRNMLPSNLFSVEISFIKFSGYKYELGFIILCLVLIVSMVIGLYSFYKASTLILLKWYLRKCNCYLECLIEV